MNNPNPFVPKGSLLEQQGQRRSRLKFTVGCVLTVGVLSLVVMLIQGCKREQPIADNPPPVDTNTTPASTPPAAPDLSSNPAVAAVPPSAPAATTPSGTPVGSAPAIPAVPLPAAATPAPTPMPVPDVSASASTYEVVAGDSLAKIAKKNGVTLKALQAANPGVDSKRLKIKQKINIPPATAKPADAVAGSASAATPDAAGETYVVKSGDNLIKIAHHHRLTPKALLAANPKVDPNHIKVGDKLNLPAKTEPAATPTPAAPGVDTGVPPVSVPVPPAAPTPAPAH
jgi:LysM repeat protein